jgi:PBP1b-binding outer membrane lipoprotein LpoB
MKIFAFPGRHALPTIFLLTGVLAMASCAGSNQQIKRVDARTQVDLSGKWNDTDARLTSDALIADCFAANWLTQFQMSQKRKPAVRVRGVTNKTDEHIDAQIFIKSIEAAMVNSGKVTVLAQDGNEMEVMDQEQVRAGSGRQAGNTPVTMGRETGADFVVAVRMASVLDQVEGRQVKYYKINFELVSPTSGEKAWIGDFDIKKLVSQGKVTW